MRGKFVVIEGLDASGKKTQAEMLAKKLEAGLASFPTYGSGIGKLISFYLRGGMGEKEEVPAEVAALLYALDRRQQKEKIEGLLRRGKNVVADRYTPSNLYQAAKLSGKKQREFIEWMEELEAGLPQPDAVVFLDVPPKIARKLLEERGAKKDIHERDLKFQERVRRLYLKEAKRRKWIVISCSTKGNMRNVPQICGEIMEELKRSAQISSTALNLGKVFSGIRSEKVV